MLNPLNNFIIFMEAVAYLEHYVEAIEERTRLPILSNLISVIIIILPILMNVAFFTLMERKLLALAQTRKGPNKASLSGVIQPFADAVKLFSKEVTTPIKANSLPFILGPILMIFISLVI